MIPPFEFLFYLKLGTYKNISWGLSVQGLRPVVTLRQSPPAKSQIPLESVLFVSGCMHLTPWYSLTSHTFHPSLFQ